MKDNYSKEEVIKIIYNIRNNGIKKSEEYKQTIATEMIIIAVLGIVSMVLMYKMFF